MLPKYKIGIVGPSRVGKTTIMTSVMEAAEKLFEGKSYEIVPADGITESAILQNQNSLNFSLIKNVFDSGSLAGDQEAHRFKFNLRNDGEDLFNFTFLDYPGGWLNSSSSNSNSERWKNECEPFIKESRVLLIPVESTIIMETYKAQHKEAVPDLLQLSKVEKVVRSWAKANRNNDCVLMLIPVKSETYLGNEEEIKLKNRVIHYYRNIIHATKNEFLENKLKVIYAPVLTFGCVSIKERNWENIDNKWIFTAEFRTNSINPKREQSYAGDIIKIICQSLCNINKNKAENTVDDLQNKASNEKSSYDDYSYAKDIWEDYKKDKEIEAENVGFFTSIWEFLSGARSERQKEIKKAEEEIKNINSDLKEKSINIWKLKKGMEFQSLILNKTLEVINFIVSQKLEKCEDITAKVS